MQKQLPLLRCPHIGRTHWAPAAVSATAAHTAVQPASWQHSADWQSPYPQGYPGPHWGHKPLPHHTVLQYLAPARGGCRPGADAAAATACSRSCCRHRPLPEPTTVSNMTRKQSEDNHQSTSKQDHRHYTVLPDYNAMHTVYTCDPVVRATTNPLTQEC